MLLLDNLLLRLAQFRQRCGQPLVRDQQLFPLQFALGDVPENADDGINVARLIPHRHLGCIHPDIPAILHMLLFKFFGLAVLHDPFVIRPVFVGQFFGVNIVVILAH